VYSTHARTHTHTFNGLFSGTTQVSQYQKGKTNVVFSEARDSEWQWHQLGHMQVCTLLQTDNHTSTPPLCFLQARCPSCHPTNSVKALKVYSMERNFNWVFTEHQILHNTAQFRKVSLIINPHEFSSEQLICCKQHFVYRTQQCRSFSLFQRSNLC